MTEYSPLENLERDCPDEARHHLDSEQDSSYNDILPTGMPSGLFLVGPIPGFRGPNRP